MGVDNCEYKIRLWRTANILWYQIELPWGAVVLVIYLAYQGYGVITVGEWRLLIV